MFHSEQCTFLKKKVIEILNLHSKRRQTRDSRMSEKKMVGRSVAIILGIICIALIACLGIALAYYNSYVDNHHNTDDSYDYLQNRVNDLNNIINLRKQNTWVIYQIIYLTVGGAADFPPFSADYVGYVNVTVQGATSGVHIIINGTAQNGILFQNDESLMGAAETDIPILSCPSVHVIIVNEGNQTTTLTVTITYNY